MLLRSAFFLLLPLLTACDRSSDTPPVVYNASPSVDSLIQSVLSSGEEFTDVSFRSVVESSTGHTIIPFDISDPVDAEIYEAIAGALDESLERFSRDDSPSNSEKRINEVSSHFEEAIRHHLNTIPGLACDYPKTAEGKTQRSGYPDLKIVHEATGRVTYLDPKLVESGSFDSSLRSFYFTPKNETSKVLHDAHHLLVGIEQFLENFIVKYVQLLASSF